MKVFDIFFLSLVVFLHGCGPSYEVPPTTVTKENYHQRILDIPSRKGTVGVIVAYKKGGTFYSLLGKEIASKNHPEKSEQYSDLGGSVKLNGSSYLDNMLRELDEESIGMYRPNPQNFLAKASLLHLSKEQRDIWYALYVINDKEFISSNTLNQLRNNLTKSLSPEYLEKQDYLWINLPELILQVIHNPKKKYYHVTDINGQSHVIQLRKFFIDDCLSNESFHKIVTRNLLLS